MNDSEINDHRRNQSSSAQFKPGNNSNASIDAQTSTADEQFLGVQSQTYPPRPSQGNSEGEGHVEQVTQGFGQGKRERLHERTTQEYLYATRVRPTELLAEHVADDDSLHPSGSQSDTNNESAVVQIKQEPAVEDDDHSIFDQFTNQDIHDNDVHVDASHENGPISTRDTANLSTECIATIKSELGTEEQLHKDTTSPTRTSESVVAAEDGFVSAYDHADALTEINTMSTVPMSLEAVRPPDQLIQSNTHQAIGNPSHHPINSIPSIIQDKLSFEEYARDPQQGGVYGRASGEPNVHSRERAESVDSVLGSQQRDSSEEAAQSISGMDLTANERPLVEHWRQQRHQMISMDEPSVDAAQQDPRLYHSQIPTQRQQSHSMLLSGAMPQVNHPMVNGYPMQTDTLCRGPPGYALDTKMHIVQAQQNGTPQYSVAVTSGMPGQNQPIQMHSGSQYPAAYSPHPSMQQAYLTGYSPNFNGPRRVTEVQEEEHLEDCDDNELLATRVPLIRPVPTTGSRSSFEPTVVPQQSPLNDDAHSAGRSIGLKGPDDSIITISDDDNDSDNEPEPISWKLPDHEVTYQPSADQPSAKISLPGLVREEILLAPDHADQEAQLFLHVFLPAQRTLTAPDPQPAHAVLNFHTIAVLVLEAFDQFEIGDEQGRGYGFHGQYQNVRPLPSADGTECEPERTRSATDANVDDIFFAVVDRWRAGMETGSESLKLIRGCQEFCDVALDVIHYVKEHGLARSEAKKRKERSDKGAVRGPRGAGDAGKVTEGAKSKAAVKRKADASDGQKKGTKETKVSKLEPRKKAKIEVKKAKPKPKSGAPGVVVVSRKK